MNLLATTILTEYERSNNLEYLENYLIESSYVTLAEGIEIMHLILTEAKAAKAKVKEEAAEKTKEVESTYKKMVAKAKKFGLYTKEKAASLMAWLKDKLATIKKWYDSAISSIQINARRGSEMVKGAVYKKGVLPIRGAGGKLEKAPLLKRLSTTGKVGAGLAAATVATAAGYGGYKGYKKRQASK